MFAIMFRCSYLYIIIGVAFVNYVPVPVDNMVKRVKCALFFAKWFGKIITIYYSYGFKITVIVINAFAADIVRNIFSSFKDLFTKINYINVVNSAVILYINIIKFPGSHFIPNQVTIIKIYIDNIVNKYIFSNKFITYN